MRAPYPRRLAPLLGLLFVVVGGGLAGRHLAGTAPGGATVAVRPSVPTAAEGARHDRQEGDRGDVGPDTPGSLPAGMVDAPAGSSPAASAMTAAAVLVPAPTRPSAAEVAPGADRSSRASKPLDGVRSPAPPEAGSASGLRSRKPNRDLVATRRARANG